MIVNLNDRVTVTLTKTGVIALRHWHMSAQLPCSDYRVGDILKLPLWELMQMFGGSLFHGMVEVPFLDNSMEVAS